MNELPTLPLGFIQKGQILSGGKTNPKLNKEKSVNEKVILLYKPLFHPYPMPPNGTKGGKMGREGVKDQPGENLVGQTLPIFIRNIFSLL